METIKKIIGDVSADVISDFVGQSSEKTKLFLPAEPSDYFRNNRRVLSLPVQRASKTGKLTLLSSSTGVP